MAGETGDYDQVMTDDVAERDDETAQERLNRRWAELLQELRVIQTGTQILTGFLLALAFQPRFAELDGYQVSTYLVLVATAVVTTVLALAPVSLHRALFKQKAKDRIVTAADRLLKATLVFIALTILGTIMLIVDVVVGRVWGWVAGGLVSIIILALWVLLPRLIERARTAR